MSAYRLRYRTECGGPLHTIDVIASSSCAALIAALDLIGDALRSCSVRRL